MLGGWLHRARRRIDRYLGAVPPGQRNTVASFLPILVAQGLLLLPVAAGAVSSLDYGVVLSAVSGALFAGVAFLMIRNLVRLWKVPSRQVGVRSLIALVLAGLLLGMFSEGPLVEARRTEDRLLGACLVVVAVALLVLAARHAIRYRADRRARSGDLGQPAGAPGSE